MKPSDWLLVVVTAASFAVSLPFNKLLVNDVAPLSLSAMRAILALPFVWALAFALGARLPRTAENWVTAVAGGVLLIAIPFTAIAFGQQHIPSGLGGILYGSMPLMTVALASLILPDERFTLRKILGCLIGLAGVTVIVGPSAVHGLDDHLIGALATLTAPLSYAAGSVVLRQRPKFHPLALTTAMLLVGSAILLPLGLLLEGRPSMSLLTSEVTAQLFGLALLGTALPMYLNYILIRLAGATNASLVMFIMPVFAIVFGALLFAERLSGGAFLGLLFTIIGCVAVSSRGRP